MICECYICKVTGGIVPTTDLICLSCYDKLQTELEKHRFIPVTERLPDKSDPYLVVIRYYKDGKARATWGVRSWTNCHLNFGLKDMENAEITHWKSIILPEET